MTFPGSTSARLAALSIWIDWNLAQLSAPAQQAPIQLPKAQITAGIPLMEALAKRQTTREFVDRPLPSPDPLEPALGGLRR